MEMEVLPDYGRPEEVRRLFQKYAGGIVRPLDFLALGQKLAGLLGKYAPPAGNAWMLLAPFTFMEQAAARFQMLGFQEIHRCIPREQVEHLALNLWKGEGT